MTSISILLLLGGVLITSTLLCWAAGRVIATDGKSILFDAIAVEALAMPMLLLIPLKKVLKRWVHGDPTSSTPHPAPTLRWVVAGIWVVGLLSLLAMTLPQGFFSITKRAVAGSWVERVSDAGAFMFAVTPQILASVPWMVVAKRLERRMRKQATAAT